MTDPSLGPAVKYFRRKKRWSIETLAKKAGVKYETVSNLESDRRSSRSSTIDSVVAALGVTFETLVAKAEELSSPARVLGDGGAPFFGVPPRVQTFVGRKDALESIHAMLQEAPTVAITQIASGLVSVHGVGGVGKTSLATEYAHQYRTAYAGVWWCPSETQSGVLTSLSALAQILGVANDQTPAKQAATAAIDALSGAAEAWLLVYDNVPSPDDVASLLPSGPARTLVTSRFSDWSSYASEIPLDRLPLDDAIEFLLLRADRQDEAGASALALALDCLPLALDHAAAICRRTHMSFAAYAARAEDLTAVTPRGAPYPRSVAATFDLAIAQAEKEERASEQLMSFVGLCGPERIPLSLLDGAIADIDVRDKALSTVVELSLVKHDPFPDGTPAVVIHRLVQSVARTRAATQGHDASALGSIVERLASIYPKHGFQDPDCWSLCEQLTPHALAVRKLQQAAEVTSALWPDVLNRVASYYQGRGLLADAAPLREQALTLREIVLGPDHPDTAMSLNDAAMLKYERGEFSSALPMFERALRIQRSQSDADKIELASTLNNYALLLQAMNRTREALPLYNEALAIRRDHFGSDSVEVSQSLNNLGFLLLQTKDLDDALPLLIEALAIRRAKFGSVHANTAQTVNNLAVLYLMRGNMEAALPLAEEAVRIYEQSPGPDHPNTNRGRSNLARVLIALNRAEEALPLAESALRIHQERLAPGHPWIAESAKILAQIYASVGKHDQAYALSLRFESST